MLISSVILSVDNSERLSALNVEPIFHMISFAMFWITILLLQTSIKRNDQIFHFVCFRFLHPKSTISKKRRNNCDSEGKILDNEVIRIE